MPEIAIEQLRQAYKKLGEFNFLTTPGRQNPCKGDFKAAKEEVENILKFDPNARELIRQGDLKQVSSSRMFLLLSKPNRQVWWLLTPEEVLRKQSYARIWRDKLWVRPPLISEEVAETQPRFHSFWCNGPLSS